MKEYPDDITYCNNEKCLKECKRNLSLYDFRGCVYSVADFSTVESYTEEYCPYYWEIRKNYESSKM